MNPHPGDAHPASKMDECINNCELCHRTCTVTLGYCLSQGGQHAEQAHIRLLLDCIQICQTSADFMLRGSTLHGLTCGVCAEVCRRCAEDCERFGTGDFQMQQCALMCWQCSRSCQEMADMMHSTSG